MEFNIDECVTVVQGASRLGPKAADWLKLTFKKYPSWGVPTSLMTAAARLASCSAPNDELCAVVVAAQTAFSRIAKTNPRVKLSSWPGFEN